MINSKVKLIFLNLLIIIFLALIILGIVFQILDIVERYKVKNINRWRSLVVLLTPVALIPISLFIKSAKIRYGLNIVFLLISLINQGLNVREKSEIENKTPQQQMYYLFSIFVIGLLGGSILLGFLMTSTNIFIFMNYFNNLIE